MAALMTWSLLFSVVVGGGGRGQEAAQLRPSSTTARCIAVTSNANNVLTMYTSC